MSYDDEYLPPGESARERVYGDVQRSSNRGGRLALGSSLLAVCGFLLIWAISAYQVTEPNRSSRIIERGVASVTDIDRYLAETLPELREDAAENPDGIVRPPGYPLPVALTAQELIELNDEQIRAVLLARSSAVVYDRGFDAFEAEEAQDFPLISAENFVETFMGLLTGSFHTQAGVAAVVLAVVVGLSGGMAAAADRRPGVLRAIGGALLGGALAGLALSASLAFLLSRSGGGDPFTAEMAAIAESIVEVPRRNFIIASVFSGMLFIGGIALTYLERRYFEPEEADDMEYEEGWYDDEPAYYDEDDEVYDDWDNGRTSADGHDDGLTEWDRDNEPSYRSD